LPIEKTLTVKNEGPVSVSLTLSAAAPYKIVSVPPTLSPGQSAQVTLRFDPSESGSFSGNVQVGINGRQGSVTSSPMTGVAHKVLVNPPQVNFGLVFIGTTREQTLRVENKGMTTVTSEIPNTIILSPFMVILPDNPLVLGPGESADVIVRFNPTTSGSYTNSIKLVSGSLTKEITVRGIALTLEEYLQALRAEGYPLLFTENSNLGLLFAGISDLSLARIGWFEQMYDGVELEENIDPQQWNQIVQALQLLQSIDPFQISSWLSSLQRALVERGEDGFREEYDRLFSSYTDFPKYVGIVLALRGELPLHVEPNQIISWRDLITGVLAGLAVELIRSLAKPTEPPQRAIDGWTWTMMWNLREDFKRLVGWDVAAQQLWKEFEENWADLVLLLPNSAFALSRAIYTIGWRMLQTVAPRSIGCVYSNCNRYEAMRTFAAFLRWVLAPAPGGGIDRLEQGVGTLYALSLFAIAGWHMHGFVVEGDWAAGLAFLPRGSIPGYDRGVVMVLRGDHCTDCAAKAEQIKDWVKKAMAHIRSPGFRLGYNGEQPVITVVFTNSNATGIPTVISTLQQEFSKNDVAIVVIYFEQEAGGTVTVNLTCIGQQCGELERAGVLDRIKRDYSRAIGLATRAYPGTTPEMAWWLAYGICGGDPDCINFLADQIEKELEEPCPPGSVCPQSYLRRPVPSERGR
jgi:hypothetical protein